VMTAVQSRGTEFTDCPRILLDRGRNKCGLDFRLLRERGEASRLDGSSCPYGYLSLPRSGEILSCYTLVCNPADHWSNDAVKLFFFYGVFRGQIVDRRARALRARNSTCVGANFALFLCPRAHRRTFRPRAQRVQVGVSLPGRASTSHISRLYHGCTVHSSAAEI